MSLIDWNATRTTGRGHTGTFYLITRTGDSWSISVDGDVLCLVDDVTAAQTRSECFEALKHVICGRSDELSVAELQSAALVAREMRQASDDALRAGRLPGDELESVDLYRQALEALLCTIDTEKIRRGSAGPLT